MQEKPEQSLIGCQLTLLRPPAQPQLQREEWRRLSAIGVERRHQKHSRADRALAQARYRDVFRCGPQAHPPIA